MPVHRSWLLTFPLLLAATLASTPVYTVNALAFPNPGPGPAPVPMPFLNVDYGSHIAPIAHATRRLVKRTYHISEPISHPKAIENSQDKHRRSPNNSSVTYVKRETSSIYSSFRIFHRDSSDLDQLFTKFSENRDNTVSNAQDLRDLAARSASRDGDDASFQQEAASKVTDFQQNTLDLSDLLNKLASAKGLAFYDKTDQLQTLIKQSVDASKDIMSSVTTMTYNIPALGPTLGPIVYEVKCLVDTILDITENATDYVLDLLKPLFSPLDGIFEQLCAANIKLLGLCL